MAGGSSKPSSGRCALLLSQYYPTSSPKNTTGENLLAAHKGMGPWIPRGSYLMTTASLFNAPCPRPSAVPGSRGCLGKEA